MEGLFRQKERKKRKGGNNWHVTKRVLETLGKNEDKTGKNGRCGRVEVAADNNGLLTKGREQTGRRARESGS